jgi:hypothetical protein
VPGWALDVLAWSVKNVLHVNHESPRREKEEYDNGWMLDGDVQVTARTYGIIRGPR